MKREDIEKLLKEKLGEEELKRELGRLKEEPPAPPPKPAYDQRELIRLKKEIEHARLMNEVKKSTTHQVQQEWPNTTDVIKMKDDGTTLEPEWKDELDQDPFGVVS